MTFSEYYSFVEEGEGREQWKRHDNPGPFKYPAASPGEPYYHGRSPGAARQPWSSKAAIAKLDRAKYFLHFNRYAVPGAVSFDSAKGDLFRRKYFHDDHRKQLELQHYNIGDKSGMHPDQKGKLEDMWRDMESGKKVGPDIKPQPDKVPFSGSSDMHQRLPGKESIPDKRSNLGPFRGPLTQDNYFDNNTVVHGDTRRWSRPFFPTGPKPREKGYGMHYYR